MALCRGRRDIGFADPQLAAGADQRRGDEEAAAVANQLEGRRAITLHRIRSAAAQQT